MIQVFIYPCSLLILAFHIFNKKKSVNFFFLYCFYSMNFTFFPVVIFLFENSASFLYMTKLFCHTSVMLWVFAHYVVFRYHHWCLQFILYIFYFYFKKQIIICCFFFFEHYIYQSITTTLPPRCVWGGGVFLGNVLQTCGGGVYDFL